MNGNNNRFSSGRVSSSEQQRSHVGFYQSDYSQRSSSKDQLQQYQWNRQLWLTNSVIDSRLIAIIKRINSAITDYNDQQWTADSKVVQYALAACVRSPAYINNMSFAVKKLNIAALNCLGTPALSMAILQFCLRQLEVSAETVDEEVVVQKLRILCINNLGSAYISLGTLEVAFRCFNDCVVMLKGTKFSDYFGLTNLNLSIAYGRIGDRKQAMAYANTALIEQQKLIFEKDFPRFREQRDRQEESQEGILAQKDGVWSESVRKARYYYSEERIEEMEWQISTLGRCYCNLAEETRVIGQLEEAARHYESSISCAEQYLGRDNQVTQGFEETVRTAKEEMHGYQSQFQSKKEENKAIAQKNNDHALSSGVGGGRGWRLKRNAHSLHSIQSSDKMYHEESPQKHLQSQQQQQQYSRSEVKSAQMKRHLAQRDSKSQGQLRKMLGDSNARRVDKRAIDTEAVMQSQTMQMSGFPFDKVNNALGRKTGGGQSLIFEPPKVEIRKTFSELKLGEIVDPKRIINDQINKRMASDTKKSSMSYGLINFGSNNSSSSSGGEQLNRVATSGFSRIGGVMNSSTQTKVGRRLVQMHPSLFSSPASVDGDTNQSTPKESDISIVSSQKEPLNSSFRILPLFSASKTPSNSTISRSTNLMAFVQPESNSKIKFKPLFFKWPQEAVHQAICHFNDIQLFSTRSVPQYYSQLTFTFYNNLLIARVPGLLEHQFDVSPLLSLQNDTPKLLAEFSSAVIPFIRVDQNSNTLIVDFQLDCKSIDIQVQDHLVVSLSSQSPSSTLTYISNTQMSRYTHHDLSGGELNESSQNQSLSAITPIMANQRHESLSMSSFSQFKVISAALLTSQTKIRIPSQKHRESSSSIKACGSTEGLSPAKVSDISAALSDQKQSDIIRSTIDPPVKTESVILKTENNYQIQNQQKHSESSGKSNKDKKANQATQPSDGASSVAIIQSTDIQQINEVAKQNVQQPQDNNVDNKPKRVQSLTQMSVDEVAQSEDDYDENAAIKPRQAQQSLTWLFSQPQQRRLSKFYLEQLEKEGGLDGDENDEDEDEEEEEEKQLSEKSQSIVKFRAAESEQHIQVRSRKDIRTEKTGSDDDMSDSSNWKALRNGFVNTQKGTVITKKDTSIVRTDNENSEGEQQPEKIGTNNNENIERRPTITSKTSILSSEGKNGIDGQPPKKKQSIPMIRIMKVDDEGESAEHEDYYPRDYSTTGGFVQDVESSAARPVPVLHFISDMNQLRQSINQNKSQQHDSDSASSSSSRQSDEESESNNNTSSGESLKQSLEMGNNGDLNKSMILNKKEEVVADGSASSMAHAPSSSQYQSINKRTSLKQQLVLSSIKEEPADKVGGNHSNYSQKVSQKASSRCSLNLMIKKEENRSLTPRIKKDRRESLMNGTIASFQNQIQIIEQAKKMAEAEAAAKRNSLSRQQQQQQQQQQITGNGIIDLINGSQKMQKHIQRQLGLKLNPNVQNPDNSGDLESPYFQVVPHGIHGVGSVVASTQGAIDPAIDQSNQSIKQIRSKVFTFDAQHLNSSLKRSKEDVDRVWWVQQQFQGVKSAFANERTGNAENTPTQSSSKWK